MRLLEWQGRELMAQAGIPVPQGAVVRSPPEAREVAQEIAGPVVLKAQVPVGGRGKAGGIRTAAGPEEAQAVAAELLQMEIKSYAVRELMAVSAAKVRAEHYLGVTLDRRRRSPVFIYSPTGGVDIEQVARTQPEQVRQVPVPALEGLLPFRLRRLFEPAPPPLRKELSAVAARLYRMFLNYETQLVEINPLAETDQGLLALDAKMIIDDDHHPGPQFEGLVEADHNALEREAAEAGLHYVALDGDIGIIGNGAGLVMATLDLVAQAGGQPASFLDIGGGARSDRVGKALDIVTRGTNLKSLLINVFGGITRCDEVARGISGATEHLPQALPVVVRLTGTNATEGRSILSEAGLVPVETMDEGAARAVRLAKGEA
ncbi:MAG: ADP-forming succinate--CoA ligase subunit beta [Candidatus Bipolaricaulota bacterium]